MSDATRIRVGEGSDSAYDVVVGPDCSGELPALLGPGVERVLVIHPRALRAKGEVVRDDLGQQGFSAFITEVPDAEEAKSVEVAERLWAVLGQSGFTRSDAIVGVGGGTVTDLAGFVGGNVAARRQGGPGPDDAARHGGCGGRRQDRHQHGRGQEPGGRLPSAAGVLCDLAALETLPPEDFVSGMAEVIKCGFIADPVILDLVEADPEGVKRCDGPAVRELIERSIVVKARVVTEDLKESSLREILNYGHTFAHALEQVEGYSWRHGEAVSVGMVYAAELSRLAGRLDDAVVDRHRSVLAGVGLPTSYRGDRWPELYEAMRRDKKSRGSLLRFVVLDGLAKPGRLEGPDPSQLQAAYALISHD